MTKAKLLQALMCATALAAAAPAFADEIDGSVSVFSAEDLSPAAFLNAADFENEACLVVAAMKAEAIDTTGELPSFAALALADMNFDATEEPIAVAAIQAPGEEAPLGADAQVAILTLANASFDEDEAPVMVAAIQAPGQEAPMRAETPVAVLALANATFEDEAEAPIMVAALEARGLEAPASDAPVAVLALVNATFEDEAEEPILVAALEARGIDAATTEAPVAVLALANPNIAADEAPTQVAETEDGSQVLAANELENLAGGTGVSSSILTEQNLTAINGGNSVSGYTVGSGQINIGAGAFSGFDGVGNFVLNTGHNNNLQSSMNVSIVVGQ